MTSLGSDIISVEKNQHKHESDAISVMFCGISQKNRINQCYTIYEVTYTIISKIIYIVHFFLILSTFRRQC